MIFQRQGERFAWALVAPTRVMMTAILALPLLFSFYVSFHEWYLSKVPSHPSPGTPAHVPPFPGCRTHAPLATQEDRLIEVGYDW